MISRDLLSALFVLTVPLFGKVGAFTAKGIATHSQQTVSSSTTLSTKQCAHEYENRANENGGRFSVANCNRRDLLQAVCGVSGLSWGVFGILPTFAADGGDLNVENFLKTGMVSQPMGVSGQAGKSRPETGVVLRDGSEVVRDKGNGGVLAEILVGSDNIPVVTTFSSPWPVATGSVFDVECRNPNTGDGAFLTVSSQSVSKTIDELPVTFFAEELFQPSGRFSFYGPPTDVKFKKSRTLDNNGQLYRYIDVSFANLSQSTNAEIPRNAVVAATIPTGTSQVVMLVGSASASRWRSKGAEQDIRSTIESFRAAAAPKTDLKVRAKARS